MASTAEQKTRRSTQKAKQNLSFAKQADEALCNINVLTDGWQRNSKLADVTVQPLKEFLATEAFNNSLLGARQGGWIPEVFLIDKEGRTLAMMALAGESSSHAIEVIEQALLDSPERGVTFVAMIAEVWVSKNLSGERPRNDPERGSAVVVSLFAVEDKKLVTLTNSMYSLAAASTAA